MRRTAAVVLVALSALMGITACEPAPSAKITMAVTPKQPICNATASITGTVTPVGATTKVVLQKTQGGTWKDWVWLEGTGSTEGSHVITAKTDAKGAYKVQIVVPNSPATLHLRMRSNGGGVVSNDVYVSPKAEPGFTCP